MKKTIQEIQEIDQLVGKLFAKDENLIKSKFGYAHKRFMENNYIPHLKKFREYLLDVRIKSALEDKTTGEIILDNNPSSRGFKYSKDGFLKVVADEKKLSDDFDNMEIEIQPFISSKIPDDVTEEDIELLKGVLI